MQRRTDPLVPILGSLVSLAVLASLAFLVPGLARWFRTASPAVSGKLLSPTKPVEVWLGQDEGVAFVLERLQDSDAARRLDAGMRDGPYRYLSLSIYNFNRDAPYEVDLARGLSSDDGGATLRPASLLRRTGADAHLRVVLDGLGASTARLALRKGEQGRILLVASDDPSRRTVFVSGNLRLERREVARRKLAQWRQTPDWKRFGEF